MIEGHCSIGEAAKRTGLSVKTIRFYADAGIVSPSSVSDSGYRLYSPEDLWRLGLVRILRQLEFGLPEIRKILARSLDVPSVIRLQSAALDLQIRRLDRVRQLLERIPANVWGETSVHHLSMVLEAMQMGTEDRTQWIMENWSRTILNEAPEEWRQAYLEHLRAILPEELDAEQAKAWAQLQELLVDERLRDQMQEQLQPFWHMLERHPIQPDAWWASLQALEERALQAHQQGLGPNHEAVQRIVDDWIQLYADAMKTQATPEFLRRFLHIAEGMSREPHRQIMDIFRRLSPDKVGPHFDGQQLMMEGLRARMGAGS